eukprot:Skav206066  [mRNA]  locus=scaffold288:450878:467451:+ [translate_table: standard]
MLRLMASTMVATALAGNDFLGKEKRKHNTTNTTNVMSLVVAECSAYPKCIALGLSSGSCCPSPGRDGKMLDCCQEGPTACSAYSTCVEAGHTEGTCCAADSKLDCCQEHPTSCSAYSKCAAAGLTEGACCPSKEGKFLDCCYSAAPPKPADVPVGAMCEIYPQCVDLDLKTGACCPTADGVVLECCKGGSYADAAAETADTAETATGGPEVAETGAAVDTQADTPEQDADCGANPPLR